MQRGGRRLLLADGAVMEKDWLDDRHFCFSCGQMFPKRLFFEEHLCPFASYICSCGMEFSSYVDMLEHSNTHEPGQQMLDHQTIMKRRFEKQREQEEQLRRLESAEQGLWTLPALETVAAPRLALGSHSKTPIKSPPVPQVPLKSPPTSQVPVFSHPIPQELFVTSPKPPAMDITKLFGGSASPTVDLWTLYQPVVMVNTVRQFDKKKPYNCSKCGQCFSTKNSVVFHHNTHARDKVFGCLGCGLLLSSKKSVPRYHQCNSPISSLKDRIITARPLNSRKTSEAVPVRNPSMSHKRSQQLQVTPSSKEQRLKPATHLQPKVWRKPAQAAAPRKGFMCRVCRIPFESVQLLQRHKCIKAQEFVEQQMLSGKLFNRQRKVPIMRNPYLPQINGESKLGTPASSNIMINKDVAFRPPDKGHGTYPVNDTTEMDLEDDCYIVESSTAKTADMIYQITSSFPVIKT